MLGDVNVLSKLNKDPNCPSSKWISTRKGEHHLEASSCFDPIVARWVVVLAQTTIKGRRWTEGV